jgi:uncharacterized protein YndB with AHSA1/START domain
MTTDNTSAGAQPDGTFTISREFAAPRATVFAAWTDCQHLLKWFGPKGMPLSKCKNDLRVGGRLHYAMRMPDGSDGWGQWTYREIKAPEYLEIIATFSDADGNVTRNPWKADWPLQTLSRTTFTETDGKTTVTLQWTPYEATPQELAAFTDPQARGGMKMGWSGTFDQLEEYLQSL